MNRNSEQAMNTTKSFTSRSRRVLTALLSVPMAAALLSISSACIEPEVAIPEQITFIAPEVSPENGWHEYSPGVWERIDDEGHIERIAGGHSGMEWALTRMQATESLLQELHDSEPTKAQAEQLRAIQEQVLDLRDRLELSGDKSDPVRDFETFESVESCTFEFSADADAYPGNSGASASASAHWWNNCGHVGHTFTLTSATVNGNSTNYVCAKSGATPSDCEVYAAESGSGECSSFARASVDVPSVGIYYEVDDENSSCGNSPPNAHFTVSHTSGTEPLWVFFNASSSSDPDGSIVSYSWTFGDGTSGSGVTTSHTFWQAGFYLVRLTVTDNQGAKDTYTRIIRVFSDGNCLIENQTGQVFEEPICLEPAEE